MIAKIILYLKSHLVVAVGVGGVAVATTAAGIGGWIYASRPEVQEIAAPPSAKPAPQSDLTKKLAPRAMLPDAAQPSDAAPPQFEPPVLEPAPPPQAQPSPQPESEPEKPAIANQAPPRFDMVRVEKSGDTVIAGQAEPGAKVVLYANSEPIAEATADAAGNWALVLDTPLAAGASDLWLGAEKEGYADIRSSQSIAVMIAPEKDEQPLVVVQDETGSRVLQKPQAVAAATPPEADQEARGSAAVEPPEADKQPSEPEPEVAAVPSQAEPESEAPTAPDEPPADVAEASPLEPVTPAPPLATAPTQEAEPAPAERPSETAGLAPKPSVSPEPTATRPPTTAEPPPAAEQPPLTGPRPPVSIEAADYHAGGWLNLSGLAAPSATLRIYYDDSHVGDTQADAAGHWALTFRRDLDGKVHMVRADDVSPAGGKVLARAEVSFIAELSDEEKRRLAIAGTPASEPTTAPQDQRTAAVRSPPETPATQEKAPEIAAVQPEAGSGGSSTPDAVPSSREGAPTAAAPVAGEAAPPDAAEETSGPSRLTVERGDNLWRISRTFYGHGIRYTTIFEANRDQIRNPHWIYPGQVFLIPRLKDADQVAN